MRASLQLHALADIPLVQPGDNIAALIVASLQRQQLTVQAGDTLVVAQKIISKSEGRYRRLSSYTPGAEALALAPKVDKEPRLVEAILSESRGVLRHRPGAVIVEHRNGYVHANAGIDRSNIPDEDELLLLLPEDPDASAAALRQGLERELGVSPAVVISDSAGRAWRNGIVGFALGTAGFEPIVSRVGVKDLYGRPLEITEIAVADELAAAASLLMGQAAESVPAVLIQGTELPVREIGSAALIRDPEKDMFR